MKTIITHLSPDLDALASCWLIKTYLPDWSNAVIKLVAAGIGSETPKKNTPTTIFVDVGYGEFDHHHLNRYLSSARLVFDHLLKKNLINSKTIIPLEKLIDQITFIDNFQECLMPDAASDYYDLSIHQLIEGLKAKITDDQQLFTVVFLLFDGLLQVYKNKVSAENEIKQGLNVATRWGKMLVLESKNGAVSQLAQKLGYAIVVRKDPRSGYISIKARPDSKINLKSVYRQLIKLDHKSNWFLHASNKILLNGSNKNPLMHPTRLPLNRIIEIINQV